MKSNSAYLDLSKYDGTLPTNVTWNSTESRLDISKAGTYTIDYYVNVATADYYCVEAFIDWATNDNDRFKVTVTDVSSSNVEAEQTFEIKTGNNTKKCPITAGQITTGQKKLSFTITINHSSNFKNVQFSQFVNTSWPTVSGSTYFDLSLATCTTANYESNNQNIGSVKNGATVELYANNETAQLYSLHMGVTYYGEGTFTFTVTDTSTGTEEVNQTFDVPNVSSYTDQTFPITSNITTGLKKIMFAFSGTGNGSGYILNFKNVTFGTYNPWPLSSESAYLDLSSGSATTTSHPQYHAADGGTPAYIDWYNATYPAVDNFYVYNATAGYYSFNINSTWVSSGGTFNVNIYDVATGRTITKNVAPTANSVVSVALDQLITAGVKKISFTDASADIRLARINFTQATTPSAYTLTVGSAKAATLVLPFAATIPSGVKAYTLSYSSGDAATATEITTGTIPTDTPVLINAEAGSYTFEPAAAATLSSVTAPTSGAMHGVYAAAYVPADSYVLQNGKEGLGFYKVASENTITVPAYRAYLTAESGAARISISFDGETTGITDAVQSSRFKVQSYYDLQGRRVAQPTKGLYIVNGKKYIIK